MFGSVAEYLLTRLAGFRPRPFEEMPLIVVPSMSGRIVRSASACFLGQCVAWRVEEEGRMKISLDLKRKTQVQLPDSSKLLEYEAGSFELESAIGVINDLPIESTETRFSIFAMQNNL